MMLQRSRLALCATSLVGAASLVGTASAQFGGQTMLVEYPQGSIGGPTDFEPLDFDGDGDLDLVVSGSMTTYIATFENQGDGTFLSEQRLANIGGGEFRTPLELEILDVDGDGILDVVSISVVAGKLSWWRSGGDGTFAIEQVIASGISDLVDVASADIDGDGDTDLLTSAFGPDNVGLHLNLGGGAFAPRAVVATGLIDPRGVAVGDIDSDGILDLVVCAQTTGDVSWYRGLGGAAFGSGQVISSSMTSSAKVALADVDGDGDLDVLATFLFDGTVGLLRNNLGSFASLQPLDTGATGVLGLDLADFDFDGDMDLAVATLAEGRVRLYDNLGGGFFAPAAILPGLKPGAWSVRFVDIDGDQDLDLVSSARGEDSIFVNHNLATIGTTYCTSNPNSTGSIGTLDVTGATDVAFERLALSSNDLPTGAFGYYITSQTQGMTNMPAGSEGVLCLGGTIGRFIAPSEIQFSGTSGSFSLTLDVNQIPQPTTDVAIQPGSTWNFQAWHRDTVLGVATSNFTEAASVTF